MSDGWTIDDYTKEPRGAYKFNLWRRNAPVNTPLGDVSVELQASFGKQIDDRMLTLAREMAQWIARPDNAGRLLDSLHEHYRGYETYHAESLADVDVPLGLTREQVLPYVTRCVLIVDADDGASIFLVPQWDEERGLRFRYQDGTVTRIED